MNPFVRLDHSMVYSDGVYKQCSVVVKAQLYHLSVDAHTVTMKPINSGKARNKV